MKQNYPFILALFLVPVLFLSNSFAQDYVHYKTLTGHRGHVYSVTFSPDGQKLASGSSDDTIRLWNAISGTHQKTLSGHTGTVWNVSFSPNGRTLASASHDQTVRLWNIQFGTQIKILRAHTDPVYCVSFSPNGGTVASAGGSRWGNADYSIQLWDAATGTYMKPLAGHVSGIESISFSPDGKTLASGSGDFTVRLWNVQTGLHKITLKGHTEDIKTVAFSPDGKTLASGSMDKTIRLWRLSSAQSKDTDTIDLSKYLHLRKPQKPTADQIYNDAIRSVMWIVNPGIGEGSGVLLDKKSKLAVTNAHVTGKQNTIDVYFPAPDEKGELIKDRNFYLKSSGVLKRLGYYTKGHVIAKNEKTDIAIIRLDGLPETAREIDWKLTPPATKAGELVYILGNPAKQELWRWTLGEYLNDHGDFLHIQSDVFGGNSGGPVLNKQGILLGIVARSDQLMNAAAIPAKHIGQLLSESKVKHSRIRR